MHAVLRPEHEGLQPPSHSSLIVVVGVFVVGVVEGGGKAHEEGPLQGVGGGVGAGEGAGVADLGGELHRVAALWW